MPAAEIPSNEEQRMRALKGLDILDSVPEEEFDALVNTAAIICETPISAISLVDTDRQWFKSILGLPGVTETPREWAFCAHSILGDDVLEVNDAQIDLRFLDNQLVIDNPHIRFYAGAPLVLSDGSHVGSLCVIDRQPRKLKPHQREALQYLAIAVSKALEARRASNALALSQQKIVRLVDMAPAMIHSINMEGRIITVNDRWLETLGYRRDEVLGQYSTSFLTEESKARALTEVLPQFFATGRCDKVPYQMVCKSGEIVDVLLSAVIEKDITGEFISVAVIENISSQKQAMRETNSLINAVKSQFIVSITDAAGLFIEVNDAFCALTGYSRDELHGHSHKILQSGLTASETLTLMWQELLSGKSWRGEICYRNKIGELFWIDCLVSPLFDERNELDRYIFFSIDITERIKQNVLNQTNAERMFLATNSGGIGVFDLDLESGTVNWDGWMYRLYGLHDANDLGVYELWDEAATETVPEPRQNVGASLPLWRSYLHPLDRKSTIKELQEAINGVRDFNTEFRIIWRDGSIHYLRATAVVTKDAQGKALRMVGANWDVTELRSLSEKLAAHDELMRVTLLSITDAVVTTDSAGIITWLNGVAEKLSGWTNAEAQGLPVMQVLNIVYQESGLPIEDPIAKCVSRNESVKHRYPHVLVSRNGSRHGIEDSAAPIRNDIGKVLGVLIVLRDVTEIRLSAQKLKFSEERFNLAVLGANDGLWDRDVLNGTVYYSPRWKSMLGYEENELENSVTLWDEHVHPQDRIWVVRNVDHCIATNGDRFSNEYRMRHKEGHYVWILDRGLILRDNQGVPVRFIGFHTDISQQKQVEKLKSEFISTVSHELRTPLTSISASLGLLEAGVFGELVPKALGLISIASKNAKRLTTLVNDILDMEKLLSGTVVFHTDEIDMVELIQQAVGMNEEYAASYGAHYHFASTLEHLAVIGDKDRLMQVMANLMSNAAKFTPSGERVEIRLLVLDKMAKVEIQDFGAGVPIEFRSRIFSEFAQADGSDTRQQGGTGLGLNISKKLVARMGGEIGFESEVGAGSTFWFTVPLSVPAGSFLS